MLSNEARKIIIKAHEKGYKTAEIADIFDVDVSSINKLLRQYKRQVRMSCVHMSEAERLS